MRLGAFQQKIDKYRFLQMAHSLKAPNVSDSWTMTDLSGSSEDVDVKQDSEWEAEMTAIKVRWVWITALVYQDFDR